MGSWSRAGVDPSGCVGPTRMQARGPHWRRTSRGFYVPADVDNALPEQRIVEASTVLPSAGAITGWAALRWAGGVWFDGLTADGRSRRPVTVVTSTFDIRPQRGIAVSQERLDPRELTSVDGLVVTEPVRSLSFEMRYASSFREAIVCFDMAAYSDLVSIDEMVTYATGHPGWTGIPQMRKALLWVDENSWSPREVTMRLIWVLDAGFPKPLCNHPVFDRFGTLLGIPDLLDPEAGVVGEYDGSLHLEGRQRRRDREREEAFRRVGLEYFTMLRGDAGDRQAMVARMEEARGRASWAAEAKRAWTTDLPPWWTPTFTVEQRRALDQGARERLLRIRRRAG